jgi:hypothetical protein
LKSNTSILGVTIQISFAFFLPGFLVLLVHLP